MLVNPASSRLHASTIRIDDPGPLIDYLGPTDAAFLRGTEGFVALGEVARLETGSMLEADRWWRELVADIENESEIPGSFGTGPLAFGAFCFDPGNTAARSVLVVPQIIVGRRDGRAWLTQIGYDRVCPQLPPRQPLPKRPVGVEFGPGSVGEQDWMDCVGALTQRIRTGQAQKIVLARDIEAAAKSIIDPRWPLRRLLDSYGSCWNYLMDGLVGSTPEMIVRREAGLTTSRVLAGTIARAEGVDDTRRAAALISSVKDLEEHRFAVSSVVDALADHLTGMHVPEAPYVLSLPNVMHLATDISGISSKQISTLALTSLIHPSAAVCGVPTDVARQIIAECENLDRGRFSGPIGWVDAQGDGEWALALRCGQLDPDDDHRMRLFAGAGVVSASKPHAELVETVAKLAPMMSALRGQE